MDVAESVSSFLRVFLVFFVYNIAVQILAPVVPSLYGRVALALVLTVLAVVLLDAAPAVMRGQTPTFDEGSVFYSARRFLLIVVFVFVAAILAQWLRRGIAYPNWELTTIAALIAAIFVFGSLVAYYWRVPSITVKSEA